MLSACAPAAAPLPPAPAPTPTVTPPVQFPRDAGAHDVLTEWWYYTGHLTTADHHAYGFEFTVFQVRREGDPTGYLAHYAITDVDGQSFSHQARFVSGDFQPGFSREVQGWKMTSVGDQSGDTIEATMEPGPGVVAPYAISLRLVDQKPPALHHGGYIEYGPAGGSYYYSRTRLGVTGSLGVAGGPSQPVTGIAWMDHQWGNFVVGGGGGWDWYSMQLDDRTELMLYVLRDASGATSAVYGSQVLADGSVRDLEPGAVAVRALGTWTSPHTGATYPSGWEVSVPGRSEPLRLTPQVKDQELYFPGSPVGSPDYWEGAVTVQTASGAPAGEGYVELTGYAP